VIKRWRHLKQIVLKVEADPLAKLYTDEALTPVAKEDAAHMELYTQNEAARAAVEREHRVAGHHIASHRANGHQAKGHQDTSHALGESPSLLSIDRNSNSDRRRQNNPIAD
jgi:hypothetical protein